MSIYCQLIQHKYILEYNAIRGNDCVWRKATRVKKWKREMCNDGSICLHFPDRKMHRSMSAMHVTLISVTEILHGSQQLKEIRCNGNTYNSDIMLTSFIEYWPPALPRCDEMLHTIVACFFLCIKSRQSPISWEHQYFNVAKFIRKYISDSHKNCMALQGENPWFKPNNKVYAKGEWTRTWNLKR